MAVLCSFLSLFAFARSRSAGLAEVDCLMIHRGSIERVTVSPRRFRNVPAKRRESPRLNCQAKRNRAPREGSRAPREGSRAPGSPEESCRHQGKIMEADGAHAC